MLKTNKNDVMFFLKISTLILVLAISSLMKGDAPKKGKYMADKVAEKSVSSD